MEVYLLMMVEPMGLPLLHFHLDHTKRSYTCRTYWNKEVRLSMFLQRLPEWLYWHVSRSL